MFPTKKILGVTRNVVSLPLEESFDVCGGDAPRTLAPAGKGRERTEIACERLQTLCPAMTHSGRCKGSGVKGDIALLAAARVLEGCSLTDMPEVAGKLS